MYLAALHVLRRVHKPKKLEKKSKIFPKMNYFPFSYLGMFWHLDSTTSSHLTSGMVTVCISQSLDGLGKPIVTYKVQILFSLIFPFVLGKVRF